MKKIKIAFMAGLKESVPDPSINMDLDGSIADTKALQDHLLETYSGLRKKAFKMAVNEEVVQDSIELKDGDEVVLLPPFSGG